MIKIYSAGNLQEAYLIRGLLYESGIETHIMNEFAQGGIGEIPFTHAYPEIWLINDDEINLAKKIINQFEAHQHSIEDRICSSCQEVNPATFETCWRCGSQLGSH